MVHSTITSSVECSLARTWYTQPTFPVSSFLLQERGLLNQHFLCEVFSSKNMVHSTVTFCAKFSLARTGYSTITCSVMCSLARKQYTQPSLPCQKFSCKNMIYSNITSSIKCPLAITWYTHPSLPLSSALLQEHGTLNHHFLCQVLTLPSTNWAQLSLPPHSLLQAHATQLNLTTHTPTPNPPSHLHLPPTEGKRQLVNGVQKQLQLLLLQL